MLLSRQSGGRGLCRGLYKQTEQLQLALSAAHQLFSWDRYIGRQGRYTGRQVNLDADFAELVLAEHTHH